MKFSSKRLAQTLTQLCLIKEIDHIVISPGSRNAPLIIGFTEHPDFKNYSIVDERTAAFFALGMAQQLHRPVALVCTSGSALLNYYPAVAEAYYSDIPLIIISADRPEELVEIGDGQTIKQEHVFSNHILYNANCKEGDTHQLYNETEINIALNTAIELNGPVHINLPFSEPLYHKTDDLDIRPQHVPARAFVNSIPANMQELKNIWRSASKKLVLAGVMAPESLEAELLDKLAGDSTVLVLTETTSNLHHEKFVPAIDQLITSLTDDGCDALRPEVLLTLGGMVISKRVKAFLRKYQPDHHWHLDTKKAYDTYFSLSEHIKTTPAFFLKHLLADDEKSKGSYRDDWLMIRRHRLEQHRKFNETAPYSDFKVYQMLFDSLPKNLNLQLANSAAIRYAQLFDQHKGIAVFCNRGTSGIDGSTSTAIGSAVISEQPTVLISGDLSFFYDSNALWNNYIPKDFRIVIVNNSGGGIFRILPGAKEAEKFKEFFETAHGLTAEYLAKMFNLGYYRAASENELKAQLKDFFRASDEARILEIFTPSEVNDKVLLDYFRAIR